VTGPDDRTATNDPAVVSPGGGDGTNALRAEEGPAEAMKFGIDELMDAMEFEYEFNLNAPEGLTEDQVKKLFAATLDQCRMWRCADCHVSVRDEYYVVRDELWDTHGADRGMLCVGCFEQRVGRQLAATDFTDAPINMWWEKQSDRLRSRLGVS
jgi:hypothetical protein